MQHLEVSGAVRPLKWPLGVKWLKALKTFKTLRHVSISYEIILKEFFISLLRLLSLKFTKNVKDPLWLCGSIRMVCLHCVPRAHPCI